MDRILTIDGLTRFLSEMDGKKCMPLNIENIYWRVKDLIDITREDDSVYGYDHNFDLANDIMREYGKVAKLQVVKELTHEEIVDLLGFDFVEVKK